MDPIRVYKPMNEDLESLKAALIKKGVITDNEIKTEKDKLNK
jgi:hypothetical protein